MAWARPSVDPSIAKSSVSYESPARAVQPLQINAVKPDKPDATVVQKIDAAAGDARVPEIAIAP